MDKKNNSHRMKAPYLGKIDLFWCKSCNIPLLGNFSCEICGQTGLKVPVSPPGDVRPAFLGDIELIQTAIDNSFGIKIGENIINKDSVVILNRISGLDRVDEIIYYGSIIGLLVFNVEKLRFEFHPSIIGGQLILDELARQKKPTYKTIQIKEDALNFLFTGKSILAPGVECYTEDINNGDYVLIVHNKEGNFYCIGIGISRANSLEMKEMLINKRGQLAKNKEHLNSLEEIQHIPIDLTKIDFFRLFSGNKTYINNKIRVAEEFITSTIKQINKPVAVAYSGGKDSLTVLLLVYRVLGPNFKIFFADTGLELPEVVSNVHQIAEFLGMSEKLLVKSAKTKFWEIVEQFGPPGRDFRYCCHSLKAQQISEIIDELYNGEEVLVFLGQRQYESLNRSKEKPVYVNSFIPKQIAAIPIKSWNALTLWLFILNEKILSSTNKIPSMVPITPLYYKGQERLGCYLCPASSLASLSLLRKTHFELMDRWDHFLNRYAHENNFPNEWVRYGLWRYKKIPPQWKDALEKWNVKIETNFQPMKKEFTIAISKGFSPCLSGGYSLKAKISSPINLDELNKIIISLSKEWEFIDDEGVISIKSLINSKPYRLNVFADGTIFLQSPDKEFNFERVIYLLLGLIRKLNQCTNCGTCQSICPNKAIELVDRQSIINQEKCASCMKCITHCPLTSENKEN